MSVRVRVRLLALGLACVSGAVAYGQTQEKPSVYRWVDDKGVVHYGDRIPVQDSQKETAVLNRQGAEVDRRSAPASARRRSSTSQPSTCAWGSISHRP